MQHPISPIPPRKEVAAAARARTMPSPSLLFVDQPGQADGWVAVCSDLLEAGKTRIGMRLLDGALSPVAERLIERFGDRLVSLDGPNGSGGAKEATRPETG